MMYLEYAVIGAMAFIMGLVYAFSKSFIIAGISMLAVGIIAYYFNAIPSWLLFAVGIILFAVLLFNSYLDRNRVSEINEN